MRAGYVFDTDRAGVGRSVLRWHSKQVRSPLFFFHTACLSNRLAAQYLTLMEVLKATTSAQLRTMGGTCGEAPNAASEAESKLGCAPVAPSEFCDSYNTIQTRPPLARMRAVGGTCATASIAQLGAVGGT